MGFELLKYACRPTKVGGMQQHLFIGFSGVKEDWPWLRKCYHSATGPTSRRVCHLCPSDASNTVITKNCLFVMVDCLRVPVKVCG